MKKGVKKFVVLVLSVILVAAIFGACSQKPAGNAGGSASGGNEFAGRTIGVSLMDLQQQYFISMLEGIKDAAKDNGIELNIQDQENDSGRQTTQLENFITMEVDGMLVCAIDGEVAAQQVAAAAEKGILTVAIGVEIENARVWKNWDEYDYGCAIGKMAGKWINENYPDADRVEVGIFTYSALPQLADRARGIEETMTSIAPQAVVVAKQDSDGVERGMAVTENWLQEHPNMRVFCGIDDDSGPIGCHEALNAIIPASEKDKYAIFGADGVAEAIARIKEGGFYKGTVDINPYGQGYDSLEIMLRLWKGEDVPSFVLIPCDRLVDYDLAMAEY